MSPACQVNLFSSTDPTNPIGPLIQTTAIGDTTVTLLNPTFISQFHVGDWVMVSSLDIQYFGFPPNCDNFDFVQITAINAGTGVLTFGSSLTNAHRSDFADGGNPVPCGKARVWQLAQTGIPWDIDHLYEGIEVRVTTNSLLTYMNMAGKSYKILNCIWPGISPSVAKTIEVVGCTLTAQNEPDKLVKSLLIDETRIQGLLDFQSSSIDCVTIRNCLIELDLSVGQAKQTLVQNCDIAIFTEGSPGGQYGTARGLTLDNCIIHQMPHPSTIAGSSVTIDGTDVIYASGVFKIRKAGTPSSWGIALGSMINLLGPGNSFSGNLGTGIVTKISEDATYILIQTTLPYVTVPSWVTGALILRQTGYAVRNCSGCDEIINLNKLTAQGLNPWGNFELLLTGYGPNPPGRGTSGFLTDCIGNLTTVTVDVIQAYPNTGGQATLDLAFTAVDAATMATSVTYEIQIDLTVAGKRVFTQSALTGKAGADVVAYNSVAQTTLKSGAWVLANGEWTYFLNTPNLFPVPIVRFLLQFDTGIIRTLIPAIDMSA
jgi:hypothetical protein